jgi:hypothetical protein
MNISEVHIQVRRQRTEHRDRAQSLGEGPHVLALAPGQVPHRGGEHAAHGQRVEVALAHRFADQVERERGEERATAEGHHGRSDAGPRNPEERDEGAEHERGRADQPEHERLGRHAFRNEGGEHRHSAAG